MKGFTKKHKLQSLFLHYYRTTSVNKLNMDDSVKAAMSYLTDVFKLLTGFSFVLEKRSGVQLAAAEPDVRSHVW